MCQIEVRTLWKPEKIAVLRPTVWTAVLAEDSNECSVRNNLFHIINEVVG